MLIEVPHFKLSLDEVEESGARSTFEVGTRSPSITDDDLAIFVNWPSLVKHLRSKPTRNSGLQVQHLPDLKPTFLQLSCFLVTLGLGSVIGEEPGPDAAKSFGAFLEKHCVSCHGPEKQKAELDLEALLGGGTPKIEDRDAWERVLDMVAFREMPPENKPQPSETERQAAVEYLHHHMESLSCTGPTNPGRVTTRRLNRIEYQNTIRDLVGVTFDATEAFPRDEVGYGFDNIGDVLSLSPLLMEKYLEAAEAILDQAILSEIPDWPPVQRLQENVFKSDSDDVRAERRKYLGFFREAEATATFSVEQKGRYQIRARAFQQKAGPEPARLTVKVDGKLLEEFDVTAEGRKPALYDLTLPLEPGKHTITIGYPNNYNDSRNPDRSLRGDRNMFVDYMEIKGPLDVERPALPEAHTRIIPRQPKSGEEEVLAREIFSRFATRAYRRPATDVEVDRLAQLFLSVLNDGGTFNESVKIALSAVLASPHFLFRWELDPAKSPEDTRPLTGYEMASRLSYFLWSSMPDAELMRLAAGNQLGDPKVLRVQVARMLDDPRSEFLVINFIGQWLQLRNMDSVAPDPEIFPEFDDTLRAAMREETERFVLTLVREDRSLLQLLDADYTYLNERLAKHYDIDGVTGDEFRRVRLEPDGRRGGVLTHASILTITSNATRTSPVNRGKWVLEQILGTPPPPPPPDVEELEETKEASATASLRERMEMHRSNPDCASCHSKMDPIGFALENYDAIGRWRDTDGDFPIDPSGKLTGGITVTSPADLRRALAANEKFIETLCENMLTYALGRGTEYYDKCAVDLVIEQLKATDYRFSTLVTAIVLSEPFLKRQLAPES